MRFNLFLALNAALFIRPAELMPRLEGLPIYNGLILACLAASFSALFVQLARYPLTEQPITVCVLGVFGSAVLSQLYRLNIGEAVATLVELAKVFIYYVLLLTSIDTPERLRKFLGWLVFLTVTLTAAALLHYYELVSIDSVKALMDRDGDDVMVKRLASTGIYGDPNDLCIILLIAMGSCLFFMADGKAGPLRLLWGLPLAFCGYALSLTHSRGGFLAMLAGIGVYLFARHGGKKALLLGLLVFPLVLVTFAGRQTKISTSEDTGQDRIRLWSEGLRLFKESPVFGIGYGRYADEVGLVAHNSFVHGFTELGFVGGSCFLGAFGYAFWSIYRYSPRQSSPEALEFRRLRPYLLAIITTSVVGMMSISRNYVVPTYMILGICAVYLRFTAVDLPREVRRFGSWLAARLAVGGVGFLGAAYVFVRFAARYQH